MGRLGNIINSIMDVEDDSGDPIVQTSSPQFDPDSTGPSYRPSEPRKKRKPENRSSAGVPVDDNQNSQSRFYGQPIAERPADRNSYMKQPRARGNSSYNAHSGADNSRNAYSNSAYSRSRYEKDSWSELVDSVNASDPADPDPSGNIVDAVPPVSTRFFICSPKNAGGLADAAYALKNKKVVLLNLQKTSEEDCNHIMFFMAGVAWGMRGRFVKIADKSYLATPTGFEINGDFVDELRSGSFPFDK